MRLRKKLPNCDGSESEHTMTLEPVMSAERTSRLVDDLRAKPAKTTWIEFKENNADGPLIGKLILALSNAARLADQHFV